MKQLLVSILILSLWVNNSVAQQTILAKFIITDAWANNHDVTPTYTAAKAYLSLYQLPNDTSIYFNNVMGNTQSYGLTYFMVAHTSNDAHTGYIRDTISFKWAYANTYDTHRGTASVRLVKFGNLVGTAFELMIIPENLDVIVFKGYVEGTVSFK